jgi:CRP/FNR family cyclic AMP-dependent transcriptional regulator
MHSSFAADEDIFESLFSQYPARLISKNRPLLYQGEVPTMGFLIKSGIIKIYNITSQGEEKIVGYESRGGFIPIEWLFSNAPVSLYYYDTFTDCQLIRVPKTELIDALKQNHQATLALLERSVSMYIGATMHLHALEQSKVRQKLLAIMQYLALRFGKAEAGSKHRINLRLTHQEIANLLGATRETTSTELGKLTKEGVVKIDNSQYVIDTDKAQRLLGEDDFKGLKL